MSIIIDIVLLLIVFLFVWRGYRNGFIIGIVGALAIIIALAGANIVARTYSSEFTGVLEPLVGGLVDKAVSGTIDEDDANGDSVVSPDERSDVYTITYKSLRTVGLSETASEKLATAVSEHLLTREGQIAENVSDFLCRKLAFVIVFAVVFILLAIIFAAIGNVINLAFNMPGLETLNHVLGALLGLAKGAVILLFIACLFRYLGMIVPRDVTENTHLLKWLIDTNPLANIIGI
ncbi:MAG: CvpA family protein [Oscillospiraceae bacterium]|nr:CvpA family protein [Oscillospiraceae bacterium]